jgi:hypothetical protein
MQRRALRLAKVRWIERQQQALKLFHLGFAQVLLMRAQSCLEVFELLHLAPKIGAGWARFQCRWTRW